MTPISQLGYLTSVALVVDWKHHAQTPRRMTDYPRASAPRERKAQMGKLIYESTTKVDFDDRTLAHLQAVIGAKVRRGESFHFSWRDDESVGDGRTTVYIHPGVALVYKYYGSRQPPINRAWIEQLMYLANSPTGLYVTPEPPDGMHVAPEHTHRP